MSQRVAFLTHFIAPYRLPLYQSLAAQLQDLKIFVSTPMEPNRPWQSNWGDLTVQVQRKFTLIRTWNHPQGFAETLYVHVPYDTFWVLGSYQPNIVISHELGMRTLQAALYCKWRKKTKFIIWAKCSESTEQGRGKLREMLRRWLIPQADGIVVNGDSGARYIRRFGIPLEKIFRAFQSTDTSNFSGVRLEKSQKEAYRLLFVGQLIERKNMQRFLGELIKWTENHPERSLEFWLVGDGSERSPLETQPVPENLHLKFFGNIAYDQLPELYAQAGMFVFPTLADEWGQVVNEAMASGLPILGSLGSQAVEELCTEGKTGWVFQPDRPSEIYQAIDRALSTSPETLEQMRIQSRKRIESMTPEFVASKFVEAINSIMAK
ncbi:MAG: glycosyltransferase family 4 protein [Roseofilum sp. SBFL]|nr:MULTISPECIES: glycosyltransferase family 4 protein [unclassified Roseofilum]MBP0014249.1 glycosyltransferase family 4 protein [Roseofilum sp. SID3]MBP0023762.1 glycosyltransferase family 4 protein [Roseofilum sp. SID2]MBP0038905.1 glycosyltransferase family 4 protein [Roseofilum sp. SID1]MBP0043745.1 glycosyltransferase family 4 protein [Roseofilum sp. SBFL]